MSHRSVKSLWPRVLAQRLLLVVGCALAPSLSLAARSETPAAFDGRCTPAGFVASPSNIADILSRLALPAGRPARLGATLEFHYGLLAQQDQGVITGRVTDASGAVLPGATIVATRVATGVTSQAVTSTDGLYTIPALPVGSSSSRSDRGGGGSAIGGGWAPSPADGSCPESCRCNRARSTT